VIFFRNLRRGAALNMQMTASSTRPRPVWLWALVLVPFGCAPHLTLQAPEAGAPAQARLAAYAELAPANVRIVEYTSNYQRATYADQIELRDGRKIRHIEDLRPVVAEDSRAARDIDRAESAARTANWLYVAALAGLIGGSVLALHDLVENGPDHRGASFYLGCGLGLGGVVTVPIAMTFGARSNEAGIAAAKHYDDGLRRRLALCKGESGVVPCQ
jgi:hypothetical protein